MIEQRFSNNEAQKRDVPSFIEPRPPMILNPFMRPKPQKATNLLKLFEEDSECEEPELVQVYLRLKPCSIPSNLYEVRSDRYLITSLDTTTAGHGRRTQHNVSKMYTFSHIFGSEANQKEIFETVVKGNLKKLPDGHSFTLLTYGASGSGKTYTLMGTVASPGLVPRSLEYVFKVVDAAQTPLYKPSEGGADKLNYAEQDYELQWVKRLRQISSPVRDKYRRMSAQLRNDMTASTIDLSNRTRYYVWVSFVEIYNEGIYDLLAPGDRKNANKLLIREDSNGNVYVKGATQAFVRTGCEAYDVMAAGKQRLQVAATGVHARSSRSHCVFTITMLTHTDDAVRTSCVRLCDLAGCERARRTRNTGARMLESRAINSSLHVLERCLHTLRRRQRSAAATAPALVPYRESKLTRLLGAGLSGARGEAVAMVVTVNPSPEYASETRHVLQLAAVARDIQINNTMSDYPSTLETSRDSTLGSGADVMRLRVENERLHFELIQAQSRAMELTAAMEERQAATADAMRSLVEEAREITRQYYESQLTALRTEMEEMAEEYESRLCNVAKPPTNDAANRSLQNKVTELMTEIAILEEKLTAERLARARAEEEVQHLRACIEERDEKLSEDNVAEDNEDAMSVTDSDNDNNSDADEDPCNESLEPTFTKEDINRSRLIRQSLLLDQRDDSVKSAEESDNSILDVSSHTIKDNDNVDKTLDETFTTGNDSEVSKKVDEIESDIKCSTQVGNINEPTDDDCMYKVNKDNKSILDNKLEIQTNADMSIDMKETHNDQNLELKSNVNYIDPGVKNISRGTYFVTESRIKNEYIIESVEKKILPAEVNETEKSLDITNDSNAAYESIIQEHDVTKETNNVKNSMNFKEPMDVVETRDDKEKNGEIKQWEIPRKASVPLVNEIIKSLKCPKNSNNSLMQFEQLEQATMDRKSDDRVEVDLQTDFCNIQLSKEKKTYFDDTKQEYQSQISNTVERKSYFNNINTNIQKVVDKRSTEVGLKIKDEDLRSPSIVKEIESNNFEPSTIKKLLGESMTRLPEPITVVKAKKAIINKHDSIDVFESPLPVSKQEENIETVQEFIDKIIINEDKKPNLKINIPTIIIQQPTIEVDDDASINKLEHVMTIASQVKQEKSVNKSPKNQSIDASSVSLCKKDNTFEAFESIYKNITTPRATEFELLVSQEIIDSQDSEALVPEVPTNEKKNYNLRKKSQMKTDKNKTKDLNEAKRNKTKNVDEEILLESLAKCESRQSTRRNLRLRRRKNMIDDDWEEEEKEMNRGEKLKDIINLQKEFSDVTIDVPAPLKQVKDIPSPEKVDNETENVPPPMIVQSCPSKSVTRSRRKLFTPRAEPLEESLQGDSTERIYVPRPSYHKPRARRKL